MATTSCLGPRTELQLHRVDHLSELELPPVLRGQGTLGRRDGLRSGLHIARALIDRGVRLHPTAHVTELNFNHGVPTQSPRLPRLVTRREEI